MGFKWNTLERIVPRPSDASIIITYRCPMECSMCNIHAHPTEAKDEFKPELIDKLPRLKFINITGGEPFIREDIVEIIERAYKKTKRIVVSTSGWFKDRVISLAERFPRIGIRVSLEGLSVVNDELRGRVGSFDRGLSLLLELARMGVNDIGFGTTISDRNSSDMLLLYELSRQMRVEFATAVVHNSFYFHKFDNVILNKQKVCMDIRELVVRLLRSSHPKNWFRAYFNSGFVRQIMGEDRPLPCEAGSLNFFMDPSGDIYPCNGMEEKFWCESMGNLARERSFGILWTSERAESVRKHVKICQKQCWMIGSAAPVMKKYIARPLRWIFENKLRIIGRKPILIPGNRFR